MRNVFNFMEFTFVENALIQGICTHVSPHSTPPLPTPPPSSSCLHTLGRRKLLIPPGSILSKICFPQQQKEVEETMFCLMKNQSENIKMTWNIRFFLASGICFILWLLLCKHDNLMLKLHAKK